MIRWLSGGSLLTLTPIRPLQYIDLQMVVVSLLLLLEIQCTSSVLRKSHPLHELVDKVNENGGPYVGLVMADSTEETVLQASGLFILSSSVPFVDLSGRRFNIGSIRGTNVIYVKSGERRLNAGVTIQILADVFDIRGIVHYGTAGSANNSLSFGDVSIPKFVAFTGSWTWVEFNSEGAGAAELNIGNYNLPTKGENLLANIEYETEELYSVGEPMKEVFWLEVDQTWFSVAAQLQNLKLKQCLNETYCLPQTPEVVYGLNGSTADIFVVNAAYRKFLFNKFGVSTVDEESAANLMSAKSNGIPCIIFRGVSDLAGGDSLLSSTSLSSLAAINALNVAVEYIELIGKQDTINPQQSWRKDLLSDKHPSKWIIRLLSHPICCSCCSVLQILTALFQM